MDLDHVRLKMYRERRGLSGAAVARFVGIHHSNYLNIENGRVKDPSMSTMVKVVRAIKVPIDAIYPDLGPYWWDAHPENPEPINQFVEEMNDADQCITVHHAVDAYLLHPDMALFQAKTATLPSDIDAEREKTILEWAKGYWAKQGDVMQSDCVHLIVGPANFFEGGLKPEWVERTRKMLSLAYFGEKSAVVLLERDMFGAMERALNRRLPFPGWSKVSILDDETAMLRCGQDYRFCYHPPTVRALQDIVLEEITKLNLAHCPTKWLRGSEIEGCNRVTMEALGRLEAKVARGLRNRSR